jgi:hypothetical protein
LSEYYGVLSSHKNLKERFWGCTNSVIQEEETGTQIKTHEETCRQNNREENWQVH